MYFNGGSAAGHVGSEMGAIEGILQKWVAYQEEGDDPGKGRGQSGEEATNTRESLGNLHGQAQVKNGKPCEEKETECGASGTCTKSSSSDGFGTGAAQAEERGRMGPQFSFGSDRGPKQTSGPLAPEDVGKGGPGPGGSRCGSEILGLGKTNRTKKRMGSGEPEDGRVQRQLGRNKVGLSWVPLGPPQKDLSAFLKKRPLEQNGRVGMNSKFVEKNREAKASDTSQGTKDGSFQLAIEIAKDKTALGTAVAELRRDFWPNSSSKAREAKRDLVRRLAQQVGGEFWSPPLNGEVIVGVAAALKKAKLKSAAALLNDLKLWHVEEGHEIQEWMGRLLSLAKKSVTRGLGPAKRANEVKLASIGAMTWLESKAIGKVKAPMLAFAWASVWMLRCAELVKVKKKHIAVSEKEKTISLTIPISKMDQKGMGVRRTLMCCGRSPCGRSCAWGLWWRIANATRVQSGESFLFSLEEEREIKPNMMVEAWKQLFGRGASGHSARRSGAMMYVRAGLPLQEIAFLGRWKSNVVLTYAEEALEEVPANARLLGAEMRAQAVESSQTCRIGGRTSTTPMPCTPCLAHRPLAHQF